MYRILILIFLVTPKPLLADSCLGQLTLILKSNQANLFDNKFKNKGSLDFFRDSSRTLDISTEELLELSSDPAHANQVSIHSINEALTGIKAADKNLIPWPIIRGPAEIEFFDSSGRPWDIKSPVSPGLMDEWAFNIEVVGDSIRRQLLKRYPNSNTNVINNIGVILETKFLKEEDLKELKDWIIENIKEDYLEDVLFVLLFDKAKHHQTYLS